MPGRGYQATSTADYRFSINGQEKDTEINKNITSALFWEYDSRIARRWNVDQVRKEYESNYGVFGNNPIWHLDPLGADTITITKTIVSSPKITSLSGMSIAGTKFSNTTFSVQKAPTQDVFFYQIVEVQLSTNSATDKIVAPKPRELRTDAWHQDEAELLASVAPPGLIDYLDAKAKHTGYPSVLHQMQTHFGVARPLQNLAGNLLLLDGAWNILENFTIPKTASPSINKFGGRTIIIDENISPSVGERLKDLGYSVKTFPKGTTDADIIAWAKTNNGAVLTNNIRDFKNKGVMTLEVPSTLTAKDKAETIVNRIKVIEFNINAHYDPYTKNSNINLEKDANVQHR